MNQCSPGHGCFKYVANEAKRGSHGCAEAVPTLLHSVAPCPMVPPCCSLQVAEMYCWQDVARRTAHVYTHVMCGTPLPVPEGTNCSESLDTGSTEHPSRQLRQPQQEDEAAQGMPEAESTSAGSSVRRRAVRSEGRERISSISHVPPTSPNATQHALSPSAARPPHTTQTIKTMHAGPASAAAAVADGTACGGSSTSSSSSNKLACGADPQRGPRPWVQGGISVGEARSQLLPRLARHLSCGRVAGPLFCALLTALHLWWLLLEWLQPAGQIEDAWDWPVGG